MPDNSNTETPTKQMQTNEVKAHIKYSRIKRKILSKVLLVRIFLITLVFAVVFGFGILSIRAVNSLEIGNVFNLATNFITVPANQIQSTNGRTNILVMGKAGGSHDGPDLTDTMLVVSLSLGKPNVVIISIPRDLWIPEIRAKINSAYYWGGQNTAYFGNLKDSGGGLAFSKAITEEVIGEQIQYAVVIDFSAFKDVIDSLGGIKVDVERSFTDNQYPIAGRENDTCGGDPALACRYQTVTFNAGTQTMNGDTALIFVRSRHAIGDEGTDTAREARQQKVIDAIKNKIMDPKVFLSPKVDLAMLNILKKYIQTDIDAPTAAVLARLGLNGDKNIQQYLIPANLLVNPPISATYDKQYVLIPAAGSGKWDEIHKWVAGVLQ